MIWALFLVLSAPQAHPFDTGNDLLLTCKENTDAVMVSLCSAYIVGVVNGYERAAPRPVFCRPATTVSQQMDVVIQFLERRPDIRHLSGAALIIAAMSGAFPCR